jgi:hypothetical protein
VADGGAGGRRRARFGRPLAAADPRVEKVCIWTPDKDLAQCVDDGRVVQVDRRSGAIRDASGVREKFGVDPERIPDYLALVGDSSDGYPGIPGIGPKGAQRLIARHGPIESFPDDVLGLGARLRCSSSAWRRCVRTSHCSRTWSRCAGAASDPISTPGPLVSTTRD